ncbi:DUF5063 domain-containing protein [Bacillus sp. V59.32b]|uniref:DUF5063 domain-containing protein n=1 Tax=Bacillus sp. V59.32b TaxID=1758642 RepID=UPI0013595362|nr:DUF5063 domain-containing protein [Bacillus sp. V59.32b]
MEKKEVIEFVEVAKKFCSLIESLTNLKVLDEVPNIAISLSELYSKAIKLPQVETESEKLPEINVVRPKISFGKYECYSEVYEPYSDEESINASLTDDILDIYQDVKEGLILFESNDRNEAIWHWNFSFSTHWGSHVVDALRALHSIMFSFYNL